MPIDFFEGQRQVNTWSGRINAYRLSTVFRKVTGACLVLGIYVVIGHTAMSHLHISYSISFDQVTMLGGVLSLLLVLRTNSAYDRWWEGRKAWGKLVNDCRNLALKVNTLTDAPEEEKRVFCSWLTSFPFALRDHLRDGQMRPDTMAELPEPVPEEVSHLPAYISGRFFRYLRKWREAGQMDPYNQLVIDPHALAMMDICGMCERIRNSPAPLSHRALIPQLLGVYLVIAPLGVEPTPTNALLGFGLAYFLLGIEVVAEELEEPFGTDSDDLPLDQLSKNIKRSVEEIFSQTS